MKTPDEIKKGLGKCSSDRSICSECEFSSGNAGKWQKLMGYALTYIQQLETDNAEKDKRIAELEQELKAVKRERDAALSDFKSFAQCKNNICHYCAITGAVCGECGWKYPDLFVWRGVCPENSEVK